MKRIGCRIHWLSLPESQAFLEKAVPPQWDVCLLEKARWARLSALFPQKKPTSCHKNDLPKKPDLSVYP
ncbi:MAG TPA: hypothetical protein VIY29_20370, partial [Ktedonobacteraceae bacterium]